MRKLLMLAGAGAMLALGAPAAADAKPGKSKGAKVQMNARGPVQVDRVDVNRNGIPDRLEVMGNKWGGNVCPPGLATKTPPCIPPGQVGREFTLGQRIPTGWGYTPYSRIPLSVRDQHGLIDDNRYIYRNGTLYVVDPATRLIQQILNGIVF